MACTMSTTSSSSSARESPSTRGRGAPVITTPPTESLGPWLEAPWQPSPPQRPWRLRRQLRRLALSAGALETPPLLAAGPGPLESAQASWRSDRLLNTHEKNFFMN